MKIQKQFLEAIDLYKDNDKLELYDPGHWKYLLWNNSYTNSPNNKNLNEAAEANGYHINPGLDLEVFEVYQKRCKFKIPEVLKELWLQSDGFMATRDAKKGSRRSRVYTRAVLNA